MTDAQTKVCTGCGRQIPAEYNICPFCGRPQNQQQPYYSPSTQPYQQQQHFEPVGGIRYVLYLLSFFSLIIGFVMFLIWMNDPNPEKRRIGKNCLIISVAAIFLSILCVVIYYLFFFIYWSTIFTTGWIGI
jgi:hypothetical protein